MPNRVFASERRDPTPDQRSPRVRSPGAGTLDGVTATASSTPGFGSNSWLVEEMYEKYRADPESVGEAWREFFADYKSAAPAHPEPPAPEPEEPVQEQPAATQEQPVVAAAPPAPAPQTPAPKTAAPPAARTTDETRTGGVASASEPPPRDGAPRAEEQRAGDNHSRRGGGDRRQHVAQPRRPDRHQLPGRAGEAARGQPQGHQRLPQPERDGQGQFHPSHRLRRGQGDRRRHPGDAQRLCRGRRRQAAPHPQRVRQPRHRRRRRQGRRHEKPGRARHPRRRPPRLRRFPRRLRGADPQGQGEQARRRGLPGRQRVVDQPGHDRHGAERAPPDAWPGRHRRRRPHRLSGRVRGRRPGQPQLARDQQGRHAHQHLRPPHHPGRRERPLPPAGARAVARRARLLRRRVQLARHALRGGQVAPGREPDRPRGGDAAQADAGRHAHPRATVCGATSSPISIRCTGKSRRCRPSSTRSRTG